MEQAKGKHAPRALAAVSFIESSFFPLPPDLMLIPMCLADRKRAFYFAFLCTIASVLGGLFGYAIGYFLYESVGKWLLDLYGGAQDFYDKMSEFFFKYGAFVIVIKGLTPFPFKVLTILSGMVKLNLWVFIVSSIIARAGRFFLVAGLLYVYGEPIKGFLEKHLEKVLLAFFVLIVGGFLSVKLFF